MACHTDCGIACGTNDFKIDWPYFKGCFGTYKAANCNFPTSREANSGAPECPIVAVTGCHNTHGVLFGTQLIGGGDPEYCSYPTSGKCGTGEHPYYGEANRALMASIGVTRTNSNQYATFSWSN
jgi:hypothetical protein